METPPRFSPEVKWQSFLFGLLIIAIVIHLSLKLAPSQNVFNIPFEDLPLVVVLIFCGIPLISQIFIRLFQKDYGADSLAAIAVITGAVIGEYFAATLVMLMLSTGQIFEVYALRRASSVLLALAKRMPTIAHRKVKGEIQDIDINEIQIGDAIVIYPHETNPVDGKVIQGHGAMDESYLTGEPYLVSKAPGASALSGSINGGEMLIIQAEKLPKDSRYANIMRVMEESEQKRPHLRRLGDQLGGIFAPLSLFIAFLTWYLTQDAVRFLAVLVIATPCPLLIAIPITIISAISLAARKGIIIKDPIVLERLPTCKTAIFDKTGTLTYGQAKLINIETIQGIDQEVLLQYVASLERLSKHPLASAIVNEAKKKKLFFLEVEHIFEHPGEGLKGSVNGKEIQITDRKFLDQHHPSQVPFLPPPQKGMECIVLVNKKLAGVFTFRDVLRKEGLSFISHLTPVHRFEKIMIVSGDKASEVNTIAQELGITEVYANQTPEEKVEIVRRETEKAPTVFMGDGINDAPALALATVGLAFGQQNIITSEAAGAVFLENSLSKVDELIHISDMMRQVALVSAWGGMSLSVIGMFFAAIGVIPPVMGALLQEGIDIVAILYALQLTWHSHIQIDTVDAALS